MKNSPLNKSRLAEFLLVDDNEDDVFLTREAFDASQFRVNLHHVDNGAKCLQFLRKQGVYQSVPTPDLILLDSRLEGRQVQAGTTGAVVTDTNRTMLGLPQLEWYKQQLSASTAKWKLIGNQVMFAPLKVFGQALI